MIVLVIDDEPLIRLGAAACLRDAGFEVLEARSAPEAIHHLKSDEAIAAIVTDIDLPGHINGFALAWRAHSLQAAVIAMSGCVTPTIDLLPPHAKFLRKPVNERELLSAVREAIAGPAH
jgi:DNA-binding NtrC family response regulator